MKMISECGNAIRTANTPEKVEYLKSLGYSEIRAPKPKEKKVSKPDEK